MAECSQQKREERAYNVASRRLNMAARHSRRASHRAYNAAVWRRRLLNAHAARHSGPAAPHPRHVSCATRVADRTRHISAGRLSGVRRRATTCVRRYSCLRNQHALRAHATAAGRRQRNALGCSCWRSGAWRHARVSSASINFFVDNGSMRIIAHSGRAAISLCLSSNGR